MRIEESEVKIAIGNPEVKANDLLFIMSDGNIDSGTKNKKTCHTLQDVYGDDEDPKPSG